MQLLYGIDPDKLNYDGLSLNPSDGALDLLEQNPEKIYWEWLSGNSSVVLPVPAEPSNKITRSLGKLLIIY